MLLKYLKKKKNPFPSLETSFVKIKSLVVNSSRIGSFGDWNARYLLGNYDRHLFLKLTFRNPLLQVEFSMCGVQLSTQEKNLFYVFLM